MNALVIYYSKKGISIYDVQNEDIKKADIVLIGCWTHGLFVILQHPDKTWRQYAAQFPDLKKKKVGFFTTYLLATGTMFTNMNRTLT